MTDPQIEDLIRHQFENLIPFNKVLGLTFESLNPLKITFHMRDDLVGNASKGILHGGVIATVLDTAGGASIVSDLLSQRESMSPTDLQSKIRKIGTIDLRIDYLRQGRGQTFTATSTLIRSGNKIAVTRMELHNEENTLIATGTASYIVG